MRSLDESPNLMPHLPAPYRSEAFAEDLPPGANRGPSTSARGLGQALLCAVPVLVTLAAVVGIIIATPV